jgi:broad specificity phosphatase PhoE
MLPRMRLPLLLACALLAACTGVSRPDPVAADTSTTTFIVVRHAEKVDASRDPDLNPAGHARAQALAERLGGRGLVAIYATEFKRTGQTVAPTAAAHALPITAYPAAQPAAEFAAALKAAHPRGVVLIAGHSNTVPDIVAALCNCETAPMTDHEYDRLSSIHVDANGRARLDNTRYGAASPAP